MTDKETNIFKVRYLSGSHGNRHGGHKREAGCALPGEVFQSATEATAVARLRDGPAEVGNSHSKAHRPCRRAKR